MEKKKKKGGKAILVQTLMAKGFTARKAAKAVTGVFNVITYVLGCEEEVETPLGTLRVQIQKGRPKKRQQKVRNISTGELMEIEAEYPGRRRVVKLKPNPKLSFRLSPTPPRGRVAKPRPNPKLTAPPPPPPETPEQAQARELASRLLGWLADDATMALLERSAQITPRGDPISARPNALLRRLETIKSKGLKITNVESLADQVTWHYWL